MPVLNRLGVPGWAYPVAALAMGKQSRRLRTPAPTGMESAGAKRRVQNQLVYSETELLQIFNSRVVFRFMTSTEDEQRKMATPVLKESLRLCMPQVSCPPDELEDLAVKVGAILHKMHLPRMIDLLRGPRDAFVAELQATFDNLRATEAHEDADLNERQLLTKWLGKGCFEPFLRGTPSERRVELSTIIRCEVMSAHKVLGLSYDHAHHEEHNRLVVDYVIEEVLLLDMQDILVMWDGKTARPVHEIPEAAGPGRPCVCAAHAQGQREIGDGGAARAGPRGGHGADPRLQGVRA